MGSFSKLGPRCYRVLKVVIKIVRKRLEIVMVTTITIKQVTNK